MIRSLIQNKNWLKIILLSVACACLIAAAIQYPLSTRFPIGPDAPAHIRDALKLTNEYPGDHSGITTLLNTPYPFPVLTFNIMRIVPISWPDRFTWWMTIAHIAVGLALGFLLYRIHSWQAAVIGISIWAPLTMTFNNHFQSGTLPQLWSLVFLILFLERFAAKSIVWSVLLLFIVMLSHPITAVLLTLTLLATLPAYWANYKKFDAQEQKLLKIISGIVVLIFCTIVYTYVFHSPLHSFWDGSHIEFRDLAFSNIAPWVLLSIPGWIIMQSVIKMRPMMLSLLNTFSVLTLVLAINEWFGVDIWTYRFRSTLIIVSIIGLSIGLLHLVRLTFTSKLSRGIFIALAIGSITLLCWQGNAAAYANNEKSKKTSDFAAMAWMQELPKNSFITSTNVDRVSEWIPLYSKHPYEELTLKNALFTLQGDDLTRYIRAIRCTHVIFFLRREVVPENFIANPNLFVPIYKKDGVIIFAIHK